jgi:hypothetical protein
MGEVHWQVWIVRDKMLKTEEKSIPYNNINNNNLKSYGRVKVLIKFENHLAKIINKFFRSILITMESDQRCGCSNSYNGSHKGSNHVVVSVSQ